MIIPARTRRFSRYLPRVLTTALAVALLLGVAESHVTRTWSFAALGDSRNHPEIFCKLIQLIRDDPSKPEIVLHTGDMVGACNVPYQWKQYKSCVDPLGPTIPVYPVIGNHELKGSGNCAQQFIDNTAPPGGRLRYAFRHYNAGFIALNTEEPGHVKSIGPEQLEWLKKGLSAIPRQIDYIYVFLHRPLFPQGAYKNQPLRNRQQLHELFKNSRVTAVFQGHEHMYSHYEKDGVHYFTTAGGGAPLYKGYGGEFHHYLRVTMGHYTVTVKAIDTEGKVRDEVVIFTPTRPGDQR